MASFMFREVTAQPEVLSRLLEAESSNVERIADAIRAFAPCFTMMVARGSSDNAALYGKYLFGAVNRMPVGLATPSLFTVYSSPPDLSRALVIVISQSGQSPDLLAVAGNARDQGAITVAITNHPGSPVARACEWHVGLHAGEERSVAATKSYTSQLMALAMLSVALSGRRELRGELEGVPALVRSALGTEGAARAVAGRLRGVTRCVVVGRGFDYATATEVALKLKELAAIMAAPYSSADFMHGPIAMVDAGLPVLLIAPSGATHGEMRGLVDRLSAVKAEVIAISDRHDLLDSCAAGIQLDRLPGEWLMPLVTVVPGQWLALHLALLKGLDPDRPRGLSKVTKTR